MRQLLAACLVLTAAALGIVATTALALGVTARLAAGAPAVHGEAPPDDPAADGALPDADLPHTTTGRDGFVVLGIALGATTVVALLMAVRNRGIARRRRRPAGWARATGRAGTLASAPISPRSRYSSRSRR